MISYTEEYYKYHCGKGDYSRSNPQWGLFFGNIAEELIMRLAPATHFDAGCAMGFLVEAFRDRGVASFGRDISEYAIQNARADIRAYCEVGSITAPVDGLYDLVTCIEVLEHMNERDALDAMTIMTSITSTILFSSSPSDFDDPTHINVRPIRYWIEKFENIGFILDYSFDASFVCRHAMLFRHRGVYAQEPYTDLASTFMILRMEKFDLIAERVVCRARLLDLEKVNIELHKFKQGKLWHVLEFTWRFRARLAIYETLIIRTITNIAGIFRSAKRPKNT